MSKNLFFSYGVCIFVSIMLPFYNIIFGDEDKGFFVILTYNSDDGNVL